MVSATRPAVGYAYELVLTESLPIAQRARADIVIRWLRGISGDNKGQRSPFASDAVNHDTFVVVATVHMRREKGYAQ
jgi:hypothetical protein